MELKVKKLHLDAKLPTRAYEGDNGYDLYSNVDIYLSPNQVTRIDTDIALGFPEGWGGMIKDRSSLAVKGLMVSGGIIDSRYIGPISVLMTFICPEVEDVVMGDVVMGYQIKKGDKIAQLIPIQVIDWGIEEVNGSLSSTERGNKGFGSSDLK